MSSGLHRGSASRAFAFRTAGRTLGVLLSVGLLVLAGYEWFTFRDINNRVTHLDVPHVGVAPAGQQVFDGKDQNILLVGNDDRSNMTDAEVRKLHVGRDGGSLNTDTMMIVHVPADGSKATLISLPRDSYVQIPGYGMNKLNSAYSDGYMHAGGSVDQKRAAGADLLVQTVSNLTGLTIDHYVQVSLMGFYDLANAIGGVPVNLCENVDDTRAANGGHGGSGFKMSAGKHTLNALQALEFVRQRYNFPNGLGDLDRVQRQRYFLTAAFRKVASVGFLFKLARLGNALERNVFIDKGLNLIDLARQMENLSANNIVGKTMPWDGFENVNIGGVQQSVIVVHPAQVKHMVDAWIHGSAKKPTSGSGSHHRSAGHKPIDAKCIY